MTTNDAGAVSAARVEVASAHDVAEAMERLGAPPDLVTQVARARERLETARPQLRADILRFHRDLAAGVGDVRRTAPRKGAGALRGRRGGGVRQCARTAHRPARPAGLLPLGGAR